MKLIIKIPDEIYKEVMDRTEFDTSTLGIKLIETVQNSTSLKEWLSSFNTDSAPICFNKIQELKRECEKE